MVPAKEEGLRLPPRDFVSRHLVAAEQCNSFEEQLKRGGSEVDRWFEGLSPDSSGKEIKASSWPISTHPRSDFNWHEARPFAVV